MKCSWLNVDAIKITEWSKGSSSWVFQNWFSCATRFGTARRALQNGQPLICLKVNYEDHIMLHRVPHTFFFKQAELFPIYLRPLSVIDCKKIRCVIVILSADRVFVHFARNLVKKFIIWMTRNTRELVQYWTITFICKTKQNLEAESIWCDSYCISKFCI